MSGFGIDAIVKYQVGKELAERGTTTVDGLLHAATPPHDSGLELLILMESLPGDAGPVAKATVRWMPKDLHGMHYSGKDHERPVYTATSEWGPMSALRKALSELVCAL